MKGEREVMKKREKKKVGGGEGARGSMGNRYGESQNVVFLGRQREQECGCCPPVW